MSKLNRAERQFNTVFRQSTILDPRIVDKNTRDVPPGRRRMPEILSKQDFVDVPTISTRGSWPMVHMIDEDTFIQMAIAARHITPDARARYTHSREAAHRHAWRVATGSCECGEPAPRTTHRAV